MLRSSLGLIQLFPLVATLFSLSANALTLTEAFDQAKQNTSRLRNQVLAEEISVMKKKSATAAVLPELEVSSTNVWRDEVPGTSAGEGYQHTAQFTLRQSLFQGGSEYYLLRAAQQYPEIARFNRQQTEIDLFAELAQQFCHYLSLETEAKMLAEQAALLDQRIKYLSGRVAIGRSKQTELLSARSQLARVTAEQESQADKLLKARENIANLTGVNEFTNLEDPLGHEGKWLNAQPTFDLDALPSVKAGHLLVEQARLESKAAKCDYLPAVDLTGNYYLDRAGILADSEWDVSVVAKWQLYGGGATKADVRTKTLEAQQTELEFADLKRRLKLNYERLSQALAAKGRESKALQQAVVAAERSYQEHLRESRSGLVSDLEVLRALDDLLVVKRSANRSLFESKSLYFEVHQAAGVKP